MSGIRSNIYPTEEDLFISHSDSLPIISFKPNELKNSILNSNLNSNSRNEVDSKLPSGVSADEYEDGQLIPWRKLYTEHRIEEATLQSTLTSSSRYLRFFVKYNQWPILILSSIIMSLLTMILDWSSTWLNDLKYGYCNNNFFNVRQSCDIDNWISYTTNLSKIGTFLLSTVILFPFSVFFALIGVYISKSNIWISKSGIGELKKIISGHVNNEFLTLPIILKKFCALIFVCSCGGLIVGYEGPLIHISCGVLNLIIEKFSNSYILFRNLNNEAIKREIISIGFVIGISLAFGAPIGGLLFSVENLKFGTKINTLIWNGFVCSSIATFIFFKFHPFKRIIINEAFNVDINNGWIFFETFPYIFVGLVCGFLSLLFKKLHLKIIDFKENVKYSDKFPNAVYIILKNPFFEACIVVLITQFLRYPLKFSYLTLNETLLGLFYDCSDDSKNYYDQAICESSNKLIEFFWCFIITFFSSNYAYSLNIPGGILLPSLTIGALIGRIIGEIVEIIQKKSGASIFLQCYNENKKCVLPGSYAIVGAASFFAGVTNTSVAAVVIVFELTGAVTYLIPLMLGVVISKTITDIFDSKSFYDLWLMKLNKTYLSPDLIESRRLAQFSEVTIGEVIGDYHPHVLYVEDELSTVEKLIEKITNIRDQAFSSDEEAVNDGFVLLKNKFNFTLVGWISFSDLYRILENSMNNQQSENLVSFSTLSNELNNDTIISLDSHVVPIQNLFTVSPQYSLLSTYELMSEMLTTNIFVCNNGKDGLEFKGLLRITDLASLIRKE